MKTIKELQETPDTNMMLEDGYLLALKDIIKLIESKKLECLNQHGQWWINREQLIKEIKG